LLEIATQDAGVVMPAFYSSNRSGDAHAQNHSEFIQYIAASDRRHCRAGRLFTVGTAAGEQRRAASHQHGPN
jgi:hypothetical protein